MLPVQALFWAARLVGLEDTSNISQAVIIVLHRGGVLELTDSAIDPRARRVGSIQNNRKLPSAVQVLPLYRRHGWSISHATNNNSHLCSAVPRRTEHYHPTKFMCYSWLHSKAHRQVACLRCVPVEQAGPAGCNPSFASGPALIGAWELRHIPVLRLKNAEHILSSSRYPPEQQRNYPTSCSPASPAQA